MCSTTMRIGMRGLRQPSALGVWYHYFRPRGRRHQCPRRCRRSRHPPLMHLAGMTTLDILCAKPKRRGLRSFDKIMRCRWYRYERWTWRLVEGGRLAFGSKRFSYLWIQKVFVSSLDPKVFVSFPAKMVNVGINTINKCCLQAQSSSRRQVT